MFLPQRLCTLPLAILAITSISCQSASQDSPTLAATSTNQPYNNGYYINPLVAILPPGQTIGSDSTDVMIYYVTTSGNDTFGLNAPAENFSKQAIQLNASMHLRGGSTGSAGKPQYAVKLSDLPSDSTHFLDMKHGGKHWVFNDAGQVDLTLTRNVMAFHAQRQLGYWAPRTKYFEFLLADNISGVPYDSTNPSSYYKAVLAKVEQNPGSYYQGVYINMEKIRKEKHRINLPDYTAKTPNVGPIIIQVNDISSEYEPLQLFKPLPFTANVMLYEPKADYFTTNPTQLKPIQYWYNDSINITENTGWGGSFYTVFSNWANASKAWDTIKMTTDYPSFAAYFLLNELSRDPDGYKRSAFLYKTADSAKVPGVVYAGPLWDKNKAFGNTQLKYSVPNCSADSNISYAQTSGWLYCMLDGGQSPVWWHVLLEDTAFCAEVWKVWTNNTQSNGFLTASYLNAQIDSQVAYLDATGAQVRNTALYNGYYNGTSYAAQVDSLQTYITGRQAWMNDSLAALLKSTSGFVPSK